MQNDVIAEHSRDADEEEVIGDAETRLEDGIKSPIFVCAASCERQSRLSDAREPRQMIAEADAVPSGTNVDDLNFIRSGKL